MQEHCPDNEVTREEDGATPWKVSPHVSVGEDYTPGAEGLKAGGSNVTSL